MKASFTSFKVECCRFKVNETGSAAYEFHASH